MPKLFDHGSMKQRIGEECGRTDTPSLTVIQTYIADAIYHYRTRRFWFNSSTFTLTAVVGQTDYVEQAEGGSDTDDYPADFISVIDMWYADSGNTAVTDRIEPASIAKIRDVLAEASGTNSRPRFYTFHDDKLILAPAPDNTYTITVDYIKDIGTPGTFYSEAQSVWRVSTPDDDDTPISEDYTNAWYTEGAGIIRNRAKRMFFANWLGDTQAALGAAEAERVALSELKAKSRRRVAANREGWS